jgi:aspartyl/asparaginyl-tRNA synthetase
MTTQISKLEVGKVKFAGIVETVRDKKSMQFVVLKDFSGKIQAFVDKVKYPEIGETFLRLVPGATVKVAGELVKSEYVK